MSIIKNKIPLTSNQSRPVRIVDERLMSYNIEMTEITGGTFWKAYTPEQIAGTEEFTVSGELTDFTAMEDLMQYYPPINLYDEKDSKTCKGAWACLDSCIRFLGNENLL